MDKPIINLETLNDKITNIVGTVNARNKSYMQNFAFIGERFLKIDEMMKMQNIQIIIDFIHTIHFYRKIKK